MPARRKKSLHTKNRRLAARKLIAWANLHADDGTDKEKANALRALKTLLESVKGNTEGGIELHSFLDTVHDEIDGDLGELLEKEFTVSIVLKVDMSRVNYSEGDDDDDEEAVSLEGAITNLVEDALQRAEGDKIVESEVSEVTEH